MILRNTLAQYSTLGLEKKQLKEAKHILPVRFCRNMDLTMNL